MEKSRVHFLNLMLFYFQKEKTQSKQRKRYMLFTMLLKKKLFKHGLKLASSRQYFLNIFLILKKNIAIFFKCFFNIKKVLSTDGLFQP